MSLVPLELFMIKLRKMKCSPQASANCGEMDRRVTSVHCAQYVLFYVHFHVCVKCFVKTCTSRGLGDGWIAKNLPRKLEDQHFSPQHACKIYVGMEVHLPAYGRQREDP